MHNDIKPYSMFLGYGFLFASFSEMWQAFNRFRNCTQAVQDLSIVLAASIMEQK